MRKRFNTAMNYCRLRYTKVPTTDVSVRHYTFMHNTFLVVVSVIYPFIAQRIQVANSGFPVVVGDHDQQIRMADWFRNEGLTNNAMDDSVCSSRPQRRAESVRGGALGLRTARE